VSTRKKRLAKDLDLLIGISKAELPVTNTSSAVETASSAQTSKEGLIFIPLEHLQRGKYQPRREFEKTALAELASSIRTDGVMQPIVVRAISSEKWEIIAGERRWRASQLAGIDRIPAVVREVSDESAIAMALIENIQRENLNAIEEAEALKRLQVEFELSQQQVAERVGKSRSVIANLLRLLTLEPDVRHLIETSQLDTGHAKVLLALEGPKQLKIARQVVSGKLSVRQTESLVKSTLAGPNSGDEASTRTDPNITKLERDLSGKLGAAVSVNHTKAGRGKLVINYSSLDELDGILRRIR
jgi:ParB family chromosome partitioning protein